MKAYREINPSDLSEPEAEEQLEELIDDVIEEIRKDMIDGDVTALAELLKFCPAEYLIGFLPEEL